MLPFVLLVVFLLLIGVYVFLIAPGRYRSGLEPFAERMIAHRGLFDQSAQAPENSLPAFCRAVEFGYGIELDVQRTKDGRLVVFHDWDLQRMCGVERVLADCTYEELCQYRLGDSRERIPLFETVLKQIAGKVPLVVEIKAEGDWRRTVKDTDEMLSRYQGLYCVESFHPLVVRWYRKHHREILRGQLSKDFFQEQEKRPWLQKLVLSNLLCNVVSRPDFIAYNHNHVSQPTYRLIRRLFHVWNAAWTIRSEAELRAAKRHFQVFIFDSFRPDKEVHKQSLDKEKHMM